MTAAVKNDIIEVAPRDVFRDEIFKNIAKREDFSRLLCIGVDSLTLEEKTTLRGVMAIHGIDLRLTETDAMLSAVAHSIAARAIELK